MTISSWGGDKIIVDFHLYVTKCYIYSCLSRALTVQPHCIVLSSLALVVTDPFAAAA